jgi:hypothetical protein
VKIRAAPANFLLSTLRAPLDLHVDTQRDELVPVYLPFYLSLFLLNGIEELFVAFNALTGNLVKEEDGIKIFVSGSQNNERMIEDKFVLSPKMDEIDIPRRITKRIHGKKVRHIQTDLVYFPGVKICRNKQVFFVNLCAGTVHSIPKNHRCGKGLDKRGTLLVVFENEAKKKLTKLPERGLPCLASEQFILWLLERKKETLQKEIELNKVVLSYTPVYIIKYYARRPRALKNHAYCSVSAVTGAWSNYAHKILEYDMPKAHGVVQHGNCSFFVDEVVFDREEAVRIALQNLKKLPGVINVRMGGSQVIYLPLWTVHLEDPEFRHKIEICGVTGYVVYEQSYNKQTGG